MVYWIKFDFFYLNEINCLKMYNLYIKLNIIYIIIILYKIYLKKWVKEFNSVIVKWYKINNLIELCMYM